MFFTFYKCWLLFFTCVWFFCEGISNNIKKMALYDGEVEEVTIVMFERLFSTSSSRSTINSINLSRNNLPTIFVFSFLFPSDLASACDHSHSGGCGDENASCSSDDTTCLTSRVTWPSILTTVACMVAWQVTWRVWLIWRAWVTWRVLVTWEVTQKAICLRMRPFFSFGTP